MKNQAREAEAAMSEAVPANEQQIINKLEEQLYKNQESLKHMTSEMMKAQEKALYYKQILMKIID